MNKLKLAHDMALAMAANGDVPNENIVAIVWEYADAMQAEADEREDKTRPKALLTKDKDGKCLHFNHEFGHKKCMDCGASLEEWQPAWSQAPDGYDWFCVGGCSGAGYFCNIEPVIYKDHYWLAGEDAKKVIDHGYQGHWQNSLRKRPQ